VKRSAGRHRSLSSPSMTSRNAAEALETTREWMSARDGARPDLEETPHG
jgi:hypothetical protein